MTPAQLQSTIKVLFNAVPQRSRTMKPWIKKTLIGLFGASILVGGLTACSGGHHYRHGPMDAESMT